MTIQSQNLLHPKYSPMLLRTAQQQMLEIVLGAWGEGRPASLCVARRGGSTTLLAHLAIRGGEHNAPIVYVHEMESMRDHFLRSWQHLSPGLSAACPRALAEKIAAREASERRTECENTMPLFAKGTTFLIDNAFDIWRGEQLYNRLAYHSHRIIAIGSMSGHRQPWKSWEGVPRWAIWEANPDVLPSDLDEEYLQNPTAARRDLGSGKDRPASAAGAAAAVTAAAARVFAAVAATHGDGEDPGDWSQLLDAARRLEPGEQRDDMRGLVTMCYRYACVVLQCDLPEEIRSWQQ